jgi:hypothetical protein
MTWAFFETAEAFFSYPLFNIPPKVNLPAFSLATASFKA